MPQPQADSQLFDSQDLNELVNSFIGTYLCFEDSLASSSDENEQKTAVSKQALDIASDSLELFDLLNRKNSTKELMDSTSTMRLFICLAAIAHYASSPQVDILQKKLDIAEQQVTEWGEKEKETRSKWKKAEYIYNEEIKFSSSGKLWRTSASNAARYEDEADNYKKQFKEAKKQLANAIKNQLEVQQRHEAAQKDPRIASADVFYEFLRDKKLTGLGATDHQIDYCEKGIQQRGNKETKNYVALILEAAISKNMANIAKNQPDDNNNAIVKEISKWIKRKKTNAAISAKNLKNPSTKNVSENESKEVAENKGISNKWKFILFGTAFVLAFIGLSFITGGSLAFGAVIITVVAKIGISSAAMEAIGGIMTSLGFAMAARGLEKFFSTSSQNKANTLMKKSNPESSPQGSSASIRRRINGNGCLNLRKNSDQSGMPASQAHLVARQGQGLGAIKKLPSQAGEVAPPCPSYSHSNRYR